MPPQSADQFFNAGERFVAALMDQFHHSFAFASHDLEKGFGIQFAVVLFEDVFEGSFVVEADQLLVIFLFGDMDLLFGQDFAEYLEVQRLAVDDDAVEVEENRRRPRVHGA
jgi:hypothetical protein